MKPYAFTILFACTAACGGKTSFQGKQGHARPEQETTAGTTSATPPPAVSGSAPVADAVVTASAAPATPEGDDIKVQWLAFTALGDIAKGKVAPGDATVAATAGRAAVMGFDAAVTRAAGERFAVLAGGAVSAADAGSQQSAMVEGFSLAADDLNEAFKKLDDEFQRAKAALDQAIADAAALKDLKDKAPVEGGCVEPTVGRSLVVGGNVYQLIACGKRRLYGSKLENGGFFAGNAGFGTVFDGVTLADQIVGTMAGDTIELFVLDTNTGHMLQLQYNGHWENGDVTQFLRLSHRIGELTRADADAKGLSIAVKTDAGDGVYRWNGNWSFFLNP